MMEKHAGGRPTEYREEYNEQARKLCLLGATDKELADFFEVSEVTINAWKNKHPEFLKSLKDGKLLADAEIANKLYHRAKGYQHEDVDIKVIDGHIVMTDLVKHYPPDTTAAIFWLKNRDPKRWRDKQDIEHSGKIGTDLSDEELEAKIRALTNGSND